MARAWGGGTFNLRNVLIFARIIRWVLIRPVPFSGYYFMGGVLKYLRFSKILFHGQKRKKIFTDTPIFDD